MHLSYACNYDFQALFLSTNVCIFLAGSRRSTMSSHWKGYNGARRMTRKPRKHSTRQGLTLFKRRCKFPAIIDLLSYSTARKGSSLLVSALSNSCNGTCKIKTFIQPLFTFQSTIKETLHSSSIITFLS